MISYITVFWLDGMNWMTWYYYCTVCRYHMSKKHETPIPFMLKLNSEVNSKYLDPNKIQFCSLRASALELTSHFHDYHQNWAIRQSRSLAESQKMSSSAVFKARALDWTWSSKGVSSDNTSLETNHSIYHHPAATHTIFDPECVQSTSNAPANELDTEIVPKATAYMICVMVCRHILANLRISCKQYRPHSTWRGTTTLPRVLRRFWQAGVWFSVNHWWSGISLSGFQGLLTQESSMALQSWTDKVLNLKLVRALQWRYSSGGPWSLRKTVGAFALTARRKTRRRFICQGHRLWPLYSFSALVKPHQNGTRLGLQTNLVQSQTGPMQGESSLLALLAQSVVQKQRW